MTFFKNSFFNDMNSSFFSDPFFNPSYPFFYDPYYRLYGGLDHPISNAIENMTVPPFFREQEDSENDILMDGIEGDRKDEEDEVNGKEEEEEVNQSSSERSENESRVWKPKDSSIRHHHRFHRQPSHHHGLIPYRRDLKMKSFDLIQPRMDITEEGDHYAILADLPGLTKEDVHIELSDHGILSITGERKWQYKTEEPPKSSQNKERDNKDTIKHYTRIERSYGQFQRSITLPNDIDRQSIQAKLENGVLHVNLKKLKELPLKNNTKTIEIQ